MQGVGNTFFERGILITIFLCSGWANDLSAETTEPLTTADHQLTSSLGEAYAPRISADGRYVVFSSTAADLIPDDWNKQSDVFVWDRLSGAMTLASKALNSTGSANGASEFPDVSSDGRFVAFQSSATNLVSPELMPPWPISGRTMIYRLDRQTGEIQLVNANYTASLTNPPRTVEFTNNASLQLPVISEDGQRIFFTRNGAVKTDPDAVDADSFFEQLYGGRIYYWDASTGTGEPAFVIRGHQSDHPYKTTFEASSVNPGGQYRASYSLVFGQTPVIDNLGTHHAAIMNFGVSEPTQSGYIHLINNTIVGDLVNRTNFAPNMTPDGKALLDPVDAPFSRPHAFSADGNVLVYETFKNYALDSRFIDSSQLWLCTLSNGQRWMISTNGAGNPGDLSSSMATISQDGQWVAYFSKATDIASGDSDTKADVYLHNRYSGANTRISTHAKWNGLVNGQFEHSPQISNNNRFILYQAFGSGVFRYDSWFQTNKLITADVEFEKAEMSADGRYVVFTALPSSVDPSDPNPNRNLYLHDCNEDTTTLVSIRHADVQVAMPDAKQRLELSGVSHDGRFVAFQSAAQNIHPEANGKNQLYLRDTLLSTLELISRATNDQPLATSESFQNVQISDDGRWVCFVSKSTQLSSENTFGWQNVFLRDVLSGTTRLVSRKINPAAYNPGNHNQPAMARNGSRIVFKSASGTVVPNSSSKDLLLHDIAANTTVLLTTNNSSTSGVNGNCDLHQISENGRHVTFRSSASNHRANYPTSTPNPFRMDLETGELKWIGGPDVYGNNLPAVDLLEPDASGETVLVGSFNEPAQVYFKDIALNSWEHLLSSRAIVSVNPGGNFLAYSATNQSGIWQVHHMDIRANSNSLASRAAMSSDEGNGDSRVIDITPDGQRVVYRTRASNLVRNDTNDTSDLVVYDATIGFNFLVSRAFNTGEPANNFTGRAVLSGDGTMLYFESHASNLIENDDNRTSDIFAVRLAFPDTDADQLPDDWEWVFYESLDENGSGDFDGDGASDADEFKAGTLPTDGSSIFRTLSISRAGGNSTLILWAGSVGKSYQVQYRDSVDPTLNWTNIGPVIIATSASPQWTDNTSSGSERRFYRVTLVE